MVARGDLGVEMDVATGADHPEGSHPPCQTAGKPVIVATQMLQSMIEQSSPTRAEVSDVANAIFDGTDAVCSAAKQSSANIPSAPCHDVALARVTEHYLASGATFKEPRCSSRRCAVGRRRQGVWQIVQDLKVKLVVIWSQTGATARIFSEEPLSDPDRRALQRSPRAAPNGPALRRGPTGDGAPTSMNELVEAVDRLVQTKEFAAAARSGSSSSLHHDGHAGYDERHRHPHRRRSVARDAREATSTRRGGRERRRTTAEIS
jgi:hypothetical protein